MAINARVGNTQLTNAPGTDTLAQWFRTPSPAYTPLNQVAFANSEFGGPAPVAQFPNPMGIRGGSNQPTFNKNMVVRGAAPNPTPVSAAVKF